jgi:hypothetical protein
VSTADRLFSPLDAGRSALLRRLGPAAGWWAGRRQDRVAILFAFGIVTSLLGAVLAPRWSLALGPIILGVPHILADARYLVARPGLHRRRAVVLAAAPALIAGIITADLMWAAVGAAMITSVAQGPGWRKAIALIASGALLVACMVAERWMALAFAHAHNFVAIALWWVLRPRSKELAPLALFAVATAALLAGALDPAIDALGLPAIGASLRYHQHALAPGLDATLAMRVVVLFAFAQAVHYVVWLRLIPEDARERTAPRPFASSWRALVADLGPWVLGVFLLASVALGAWALFDLARARAGYLRVAVVHGHLEVLAAALFFVEGLPGRAAR